MKPATAAPQPVRRRRGSGRGPALRGAVAALAALALLLFALDHAFPLPPAARAAAASSGAQVVLAADGTPLRSWPGADGQWRLPVGVDAVSPIYLDALLHYEDRGFAWHPGVNPVALVRAGWQWWRHGRIVSGGSTLTMQVARCLEPPPPGTPSRSVGAKLRQIARALQLEAHFSKREILALYLHHAPMGGPLQGVEMASRAYLGKPSRDLSHAEAALLVALPQAPSRLRPDRAPAAAQAARDKVLRRLRTLGVWDAATVADAQLERVFAPPLRARFLAPLAALRLRQAAATDSPPADPAAPSDPAAALDGQVSRRRPAAEAGAPSHDGAEAPAVIRSTLDAGVQTRLEQLLQDRLGSLPDAVSIAALVVDNETLAVRGYAGSADFTDPRRAAHVDMVRAVRSPGSTLKPFLYAMALDDGLVHSESLLVDAPQSFGGYAPGNFQASFSGPVGVSDALQRSLNVPAVDLLERIGPARFAAQLRNAGVRLRMADGAAPNLSLILGGAGTTLEELVGAYTALARGGVAGRPRLTPEAPLVETRLMSEGAAFIVREILENGGRPDAPFRESAARVAWKTGTSFGFRDAWAVGVTDRHTVGVWVGRPDGTPNPGHFGANTAAPLVKDVLAALGDSATRPRSVPATVRAVDICWPLGLAAAATPAAHCRLRRAAWTLDGTAPPTLPDRVHGGGGVDTAWVDERLGTRVPAGCAGGDGVRAASGVAGPLLRPVEYARWPTLLEPWVDDGWRSPAERLPSAAGCDSRSPRRTLRITGIDAGSVIRAAAGGAAAVVRVQAIGSAERVDWLLDGRLVGSTEPRTPALRLPLGDAGDHALTAVDAHGRYEQVAFRVR